MKFIKGKTQKYFLRNETIEDLEGEYYFLKEREQFVVDLYYHNSEGTRKITDYTKEYAKKLTEEKLEKIINENKDRL